jgi:predicted AlkP superfamily phosphohydrolase/phosphomutase
MRPLVIIGLDGATWKVVRPLAEKGVMPITGELMRRGFSTMLNSVIPPITGPAWVSFATGLNPGRTGVFDFMTRRDFSYSLNAINSSDFKGKAFWDHLSENGFRVGVLNFPMLYPPYSLNGFVVSGMGSSIEESISYPTGLKEEMKRIVPGYRVTLNFFHEKYKDEWLFLKDLNETFENRLKLCLHLLRKQDTDLFTTIFQATDWIQHVLWRHIDESHPAYDPVRSPAIASAVDAFWHRVDAGLGEILEAVGDTGNLLIVSDHGFGPMVKDFNVAAWLVESGYMKLKPGLAGGSAKARNRLAKSLLKLGTYINFRKFVPEATRRSFLRKLGVGWGSSMTLSNMIDFTKSRAYVLGHSRAIGCIYLNVAGREPMGILEKEEALSTREEIVINLSKYASRSCEDGELQVFYPEEIYEGPLAELAPDIIFQQRDRHWQFLDSPPGGPVIINQDDSPLLSGAHRMDGILLAAGPDIAPGSIKEASILDMAPTILYMFGLEAEESIDGRVLSEMIQPGYTPPARRKTAPVEDVFLDSLNARISKLRAEGKL